MFNIQPATVRRTTDELLEVHLDRGIRICVVCDIRVRPGQVVEVLMRGVVPQAIRPLLNSGGPERRA